MLEIDRYALARAAQLQDEVLAHYEVYEFHPVVSKLQVFCSEDLGAFYLDVLKDRLYTTAPKSCARRSAQTALWHITHAMLRWMAPFLSFTAEEAWQVFAPGQSIVDLHRDLLATSSAGRRGAAREVGAHPRDPRRGEQGDRGAAHRRASVGSSLQAELAIARRRRATTRCSPRWATTCASSRSRRRRAVAPADELQRRRSTPSTATPSASAAGTGATTSAPTPAHPTICGRCTSNLLRRRRSRARSA